MSKFNPETHRLQAKTQFVRGSLQKSKGSYLTDEETAGLSDQAIADGITLGTFEAVEREPEAEAGQAGDGQGDGGKAEGGAADAGKAGTSARKRADA